MQVTKIILSILCGLVGCFASICLVWGLLYLCIDPVKTWTDDHIFNPPQEEIVDESTSEDSETDVTANVRFNFVDNTIKVDL